jgi:hypothetical protein
MYFIKISLLPWEEVYQTMSFGGENRNKGNRKRKNTRKKQKKEQRSKKIESKSIR